MHHPALYLCRVELVTIAKFNKIWYLPILCLVAGMQRTRPTGQSRDFEASVLNPLTGKYSRQSLASYWEPALQASGGCPSGDCGRQT
jgi:hypothetical protein